jgi:hypothetical protein
MRACHSGFFVCLILTDPQESVDIIIVVWMRMSWSSHLPFVLRRNMWLWFDMTKRGILQSSTSWILGKFFQFLYNNLDVDKLVAPMFPLLQGLLSGENWTDRIGKILSHGFYYYFLQSCLLKDCNLNVQLYTTAWFGFMGNMCHAVRQFLYPYMCVFQLAL